MLPSLQAQLRRDLNRYREARGRQETHNHIDQWRTFHLPRDHNMSRIENGEIKIKYRKKGNQMQATEVVAAR